MRISRSNKKDPSPLERAMNDAMDHLVVDREVFEVGDTVYTLEAFGKRIVAIAVECGADELATERAISQDAFDNDGAPLVQFPTYALRQEFIDRVTEFTRKADDARAAAAIRIAENAGRAGR